MSIWESSRWFWGKLLSLSFFAHASLAISLHFYVLPIFSGKLCFPICLFLSFLLLAEFPLSSRSLSFFLFFTDWQASLCIKCSAAAQSGSSPLAVFMIRRPELLKAGALTKKRTNDRECCQSNTQTFQRCKQMCACTKGRSRDLFSASTESAVSFLSLTYQAHAHTKCLSVF